MTWGGFPLLSPQWLQHRPQHPNGCIPTFKRVLVPKPPAHALYWDSVAVLCKPNHFFATSLPLGSRKSLGLEEAEGTCFLLDYLLFSSASLEQ